MRGFQIAIVVCAFAGLSIAASGSPTYAADPNVIFGQWIEKLPNGNAMVTDCEPNSIESFGVDVNGIRVKGAGLGKYQVTYKNLDESTIGVNFFNGDRVMVIIKDKDTIVLDFRSRGAHVLKRLNSHPSAESLSPIIQLFLDACAPNMGKPDGVRAY